MNRGETDYTRRGPYWVLPVALLAACSVDTHGLASVGPVPGTDGGRDAFATADGRARDGASVDAGTDAPICSVEARRCDGEVLWTCVAGLPQSMDCAAAGAFCDAAGAVPSCEPWVCVPDTTSCSPDETAVLVCDGRGTDASPSPCPAGCDTATAACRPVLDCPGAIDIGAESRTFDLCDHGADERPVAGGDCDSGANGREAVFRLVLDARRDVLLDLADVDGWVPIDTVLYVRRACGDAASQVACSDDIPCEDSTVDDGCYLGGTQVRQSRLRLALDPGTYFVVADNIDRWEGLTHFRCGDVELQVSFP